MRGAHLMDVWRITVTAIRRWYVLLPLVALTVLLAWGVGQGVEEEFDVTGVTMLVPGRTISEIANPYGGPADANIAVAVVLNSPETRRQIDEQGLISLYEVTPQPNSSVMNFEVRGESSEVAVQTGTAVFEMAATELLERQTAAKIPSRSRYSIDVLQTPSVSDAVTDGKLRNMAVVGVLGFALSLVVTVLFDDIVGLVRRRRRPRGETAQEPDSNGPGPDLGTGAESRGTAVSDAG